MEEKKTISFSMTLTEYNLIKINASAKGLSPSAYCKNCVSKDINKYPAKGVLAELARQRTESK